MLLAVAQSRSLHCAQDESPDESPDRKEKEKEKEKRERERECATQKEP